MSDGITESRRGTYYNKEKNSTYRSYPVWQEPHKEVNIEHMPNQKKHKFFSFIKSGIRIIGYLFIPYDLVLATGILIFSEIIGVIEELV
jgi:hypothetical protein